MGQRPLGLGCPQQGCLGGSAVPFADICAIASQERPIPSGVYAAYQGSMHRNVALKILEDASLSTEGASRFEREAWIAGSLSHPNIVKVHAYGIAGNARYIAMELIDGPSLHEEIREAKKAATDIAPDGSKFVSVGQLDRRKPAAPCPWHPQQ